MRTSRILSFVIGLTASMLVLPAGAETIATFADPSNDANQPLFNFADELLLTGGWDDGGLDLKITAANVVIPNATFAVTPLTVIAQPYPGLYMLEALDANDTPTSAVLEFYDANDVPVLRYTFGVAALAMSVGWSATELYSPSNVDIWSPYLPDAGTYEDSSFSFTMVNLVEQEQPALSTWTSAFSSSAVIPEPTSLTLAGLALVLLTRRR